MDTPKKRFIELHGEDAWEEEKKRRNFVKNQWKKRNKEKVKEGGKQYYAQHKEIMAEKQKEYLKTPKGRAKSMLGNYKRFDKETGTGTCTLTQRWILENIFNSSCIYCGESDWRKLGCDRIDNSKPHTPDNCVCACLYCNAERADRWAVEEFIKLKHQRVTPNCATHLQEANI